MEAGDKFISESEEQTIQMAEQFATQLQRGDVVVLDGELGAGKTEFVKGICQFFAVDDLVTSPTFSIINQYAGATPGGEPLKVYHVDLYRIESPDQLQEVGFDDMVFAHDAIKLVEWPANASDHLPDSYWRVVIESNEENDDHREITITRVEGDVA